MKIFRIPLILGLLTASNPLLADVFFVQPATTTVTVGQTFTVGVNVSAATDLAAFQFDIGFDPSVLKALSVSEGPFLKSGGATLFIPPSIDNALGTISNAADVLLGPPPGVNGSGTLLDVSFEALAVGSSTISLFNVIAENSLIMGIPVIIESGTVTVADSGPAPVPEPASWFLLATAVLGVCGRTALRRRG